MPKKVSKRQCDKMMKELIARMDQYKNVERPTQQNFLDVAQESSKQKSALEFLEAKGMITCTKNQVSGKLLRVHVEKPGITYFEDTAEVSRTKRIELIRYLITTAIALAALVKAFLPEISAVLAQLSPPA